MPCKPILEHQLTVQSLEVSRQLCIVHIGNENKIVNRWLWNCVRNDIIQLKVIGFERFFSNLVLLVVRKYTITFIWERLSKSKILNVSNIYNHFHSQKVTKFERISKYLYDYTKNMKSACALCDNRLFFIYWKEFKTKTSCFIIT